MLVMPVLRRCGGYIRFNRQARLTDLGISRPIRDLSQKPMSVSPKEHQQQLRLADLWLLKKCPYGHVHPHTHLGLCTCYAHTTDLLSLFIGYVFMLWITVLCLDTYKGLKDR